MKKICLLAWSLFLLACHYSDPRDTSQAVNKDLFKMTKKAKKKTPHLTDKRMQEASGMERSEANKNMLWVHNDSGGKPQLFLIDTIGNLKMIAHLEGIVNTDWEDITLAHSAIYIGDIGDNAGQRNQVYIHKIPEPTYTEIDSITIPSAAIETMTIRYKNGSRDAESLLYDYVRDELVIITKREDNCFVYTFPFQNSEVTLTPYGTIPLKQFTGGDAKPNGEVLVKNYHTIFYWPASQESIASRVVKGAECTIPYLKEPQGEAICWTSNGFFTLSEHNRHTKQYIYFSQEKTFIEQCE